MYYRKNIGKQKRCVSTTHFTDECYYHWWGWQFNFFLWWNGIGDYAIPYSLSHIQCSSMHCYNSSVLRDLTEPMMNVNKKDDEARIPNEDMCRSQNRHRRVHGLSLSVLQPPSINQRKFLWNGILKLAEPAWNARFLICVENCTKHGEHSHEIRTGSSWISIDESRCIVDFWYAFSWFANCMWGNYVSQPLEWEQAGCSDLCWIVKEQKNERRRGVCIPKYE